MLDTTSVEIFTLEPKLDDFERINQRAYDQFSHVYEIITLRPDPEGKNLQKRMISEFVDRLAGERSVLDIGCGVGFNLKLLEELGVSVSGVDISQEMLRYASQRCPNARLYHSSLAEFEIKERFDGVVMEAFIHLFPEFKVRDVLEKVKVLLKPEGIGTLTTTRSDHSYEGFFAKEEDYPQSERRFRRFWKPESLVYTMQEAGFKILEEQCYHNFRKDWVRLTFQND